VELCAVIGFVRDFDLFGKLSHTQAARSSSALDTMHVLTGSKFALLSSVGSAGLNSIVNTLPARDIEEFEKFPVCVCTTACDFNKTHLNVLSHGFMYFQPKTEDVLA
jgi:hypothetical protein